MWFYFTIQGNYTIMLNFFAPIYNSVLIFLTDLEEIIPYVDMYGIYWMCDLAFSDTWWKIKTSVIVVVFFKLSSMILALVCYNKVTRHCDVPIKFYWHILFSNLWHMDDCDKHVLAIVSSIGWIMHWYGNSKLIVTVG